MKTYICSTHSANVVIRRFVIVTLWVVGVVGLSQAHAQHEERPKRNDPPILVLGVAAVPEFLGSDTLQAAPLIVTQFRSREKLIQITGTQVRIGVSEQGNWLAGPLLNLVPSRDDSVTDERVRAFESVDLSFEVGAFVDYSRPMGKRDEGRSSTSMAIKRSISGDWKGSSLTLDTEYSWAATFMWRLAVGGALTIVDDEYADSRFGVSAANAQRSGLTAFNASGGLNDATLSVRSIVSFSPAWGVFTRVAYTQLLHDAKDSPIVTTSGSESQWFAGLGVFRNLSP